MRIAHISEDGREEPIKEHLQAVAEKAAGYACVFGSSDWAYNMGLLHDIGKYSDGFQRRIKENGPKVDHSSAGAFAISGSDIGKLLAFCIAGHHAGLPDGRRSGRSIRSGREESTLEKRLDYVGDDIKSLSPLIEVDNLFMALKSKPEIPPVFEKEEVSFYTRSFWIRMMFSCLVDADFLATEAFMKGKPRANTVNASIIELRDAFEEKIKEFYPPKTPLNKLRCEVMDACKKAAAERPGFYSLTVPTGGGKTLASLRFALHHVSHYGKGTGRIIYAIPYTSIIEQNADVFRDFLGGENVLEHHSGFNFDSIEEDNKGQGADVKRTKLLEHLRLASENWDAPIVVTTNVQFFESLYANKTSRCRKLHNIANSTIILDEAQMLPIEQLQPCIAALGELVQNYGCSVVFCTATQPALDGIIEGFNSSSDVIEICPFKNRLFTELNRVDYRIVGKLGNEELASRLRGCNQALCIVNSRKQAKDVFNLVEGDDAFHLSTLMHAEHRRKTIAEIKNRLDVGLPCRVVSTSLVEAGIDFDFPVVYRAMSGLDSIVQAAGRCNRNNKQTAEDSPVYVFEPKEEYSIPSDVSQHAAITKSVLLGFGAKPDGNSDDHCEQFDLGRLDVIEEYFKRLYSLRQGGMDKSAAYKSMLEDDSFPFRSVAEDFHIIEESGYSVVVPSKGISSDIEKLRSGAADRQTMRRLRQYSVNVYEHDLRLLREQGALEQISEREYVMTNPEGYSKDYGLVLEERYGEAKFM